VVLSAFENAFQDCQIRYDTACVEVFGAVENDMVTFRGNFEITVARIDRSTNKLFEHQSELKYHTQFSWESTYQILLNKYLLDALGLILGTYHVGSCRP